MLLKLATTSLLNRKGSVLLTILAMTVSIFTLLAVEHVRQQAKASFTNTTSGVDLVVGAKTGSLNLLLYSVFRIGTPINNISFASFKHISAHPDVAWSIPISLGDSHKGYRVVGTSKDYFTHFKYGQKRQLIFSAGGPFEDFFDVVLGAEVAKKLGYQLEDKLILAHGVANTSFSLHDDTPFSVAGVLAPTGTPVDQALYVSLAGIEAIHINWKQGVNTQKHPEDQQLKDKQLQPKNITAMMIGLTSRIKTFQLQRSINEFKKEPLLAILPGVALSELWQMMHLVENILLFISFLVLTAALLGLSAMLLTAMRERQQEIQLLRTIGAPASFLFILIELEATLITLTSIVLSVILLSLGLALSGDMLTERFGLYLSANIFSKETVYFSLSAIGLTSIAAAIPAIGAYKDARSTS